MGYLRFIIQTEDVDSGHRQGVFQALAAMEDANLLYAHEQDLWRETYDWFRHHLEKPARLSRASRPHAKAVALSWFKDSASQHIARMRTLAAILTAHGVACEMIVTDRPGYIVYEDDYQIAAEPFEDTGT